MFCTRPMPTMGKTHGLPPFDITARSLATLRYGATIVAVCAVTLTFHCASGRWVGRVASGLRV